MINIFADFNRTTIGKEVYRQGSAPEILPDEFYTIQNYNTNNNLEADNETKEIRWDWTIIFYTKNIANIYTGIANAITLLNNAGYEIDGNGYDFSGKYDGWEARTFDVTKIEYI